MTENSSTALDRDALHAIRKRLVVLLAVGAVVALLAIAVIAVRPARHVSTATARNVPLSVSCPTTTFCMAVDDQGNAIRFDGTRWSRPVHIVDEGMTSVSCASPTFCAAADIAGSTSLYRGHGWSTPHIVDRAAGGQLDLVGISGITTMSCPSPTFCLAGDVLGKYFTFNGRHWSHRERLEPLNPYFDKDSFLKLQAVVGVSCPNASFCGAVTAVGRALTWDGTTWSAPHLLVPVAVALSHQAFELPAVIGVSCAGPTFCAAVDPSGDVHTFDGSRWARPTPIDPTSATQGNRDGLTAVSCPTSRFCMAVDDLGRALTWDGRSWTSPAQVDPTLGLSAVSCPTARFCVALNDLGDALVFNGASWSGPRAIGG